MPPKIEGVYFVDGGWFWSDENCQLRGDPENGFMGYETQEQAVEAMRDRGNSDE